MPSTVTHPSAQLHQATEDNTIVEQWFLPTVSEILLPDGSLALEHSTAQQRWRCAVAALGTLLERQVLATGNAAGPIPANDTVDGAFGDIPLHGLILSGPSPIFNHPLFNASFSTWTFSCRAWRSPWQLPARDRQAAPGVARTGLRHSLPLLPIDPLSGETFCLVLTSYFSCAMTLVERSGGSAMQFSFDPDEISRIWQALRMRIVPLDHHHLERLDPLVAQFSPVDPHYGTVMEFGQLLLQSMPPTIATTPKRPPTASQTAKRRQERITTPKPAAIARDRSNPAPSESLDVQLLQAIAHGVRTPLATIRTLTRLMMKRRSLTADLLPYLEKIDLACTDQIERFDLIFKAVEMESNRADNVRQPLTLTPLAQVFHNGMERWQRQAAQHNLKLNVELPKQLPTITSDATLLDRMLTELIENLTRGLPAGSEIAMRVSMAGHQLKLQLHCHELDRTGPQPRSDQDKRTRSIGQVLTFQPETGNLGINLKVTKNLFQSIGGKMIVRQRPDVGEVVTIFLPLATPSAGRIG